MRISVTFGEFHRCVGCDSPTDVALREAAEEPSVPGITIDWAELEMAFEHHDGRLRSALDRRTGRIHSWPAEEPPTSAAELVNIDGLPARDQYRIMERFIETVTHPPLRDALLQSIVGKGAFRRFKDALGRYPDERKRWFSFRDALLHRHVLDWLKLHRIELTEMPAWNLEPPMVPAPVLDAAAVHPVAGASTDFQALRGYLLSWARNHGDEHHFLFGPAAFEQLAVDLGRAFVVLPNEVVTESDQH
jgi:Uncharacterised protein family (UPF0158)